MFIKFKELPNEGTPSDVNEVCFHPNGDLFGATYLQKDEVRLYDTRSMSLVRVLRNPNAMLNEPHGLLITQKHLIVSNKGVRPSTFQVFRLEDESGVPVHTYTTPYSQLSEGHSIALNGRRLVVSYCEGADKKGAVVSYDYDDDSGRIEAPLDIQETWLRRNGAAKGICFDGTGRKVYVTFQSDLLRSRLGVIRHGLNAISFGRFGRTRRNGIVAFGIDQKGRFTRRPIWARVFTSFCRLESIHIRAAQAVVANASAGCVHIYDLREKDTFAVPAEILSETLVFPHGAKLSPDGTLLVVGDNGVEVVKNRVRWGSYVSPRMDRLVVFKLHTSEIPS